MTEEIKKKRKTNKKVDVKQEVISEPMLQEQSNNVVVLDLDDTLACLKRPLMKVLNKITGKSIHWKEWDRYDICSIYDISHESFRDMLIDSDILLGLNPYEDSIKFVNEIKDLGYEIVIVTARGWHPNAYDVTSQWLKNNDVHYDKLFITNHNEPKYKKLQNYNRIKLAVDDSYKNIQDYIESGKIDNVVLFHHPWNKNYNYDKIINNIYEAMDYVRRP
jgi:uncharacterized HAD superfamily protein